MNKTIAYIVALIGVAFISHDSQAEAPLESQQTFLKITGVPAVFDKNTRDKWALVIVDQLYDSSTDRPVELNIDKTGKDVSACVVYSNMITRKGNSSLSYNLKIYRIDFLRSRSHVFTMDAFDGLPRNYIAPGGDASPITKDSPVVTFIENP